MTDGTDCGKRFHISGPATETAGLSNFVLERGTMKSDLAADLQGESKKSLPENLWQFFQNGWEFFNQILHAYYVFLSTLDYEFLSNYLQH